MRRWWKPLMTLVVLVCGIMWLYQIRFTPAAAVRSGGLFRGAHLQTVHVPGAAGVLLREGGVYHAGAACRWGLVFWRLCGGTSLSVTADKDEPVVETMSWNSGQPDGWGIAVFVGVVRDERIAKVVWEDEERVISSDRHFLFVRRTHHKDGFGRATARTGAGLELYEWGLDTFYAWRPLR